MACRIVMARPSITCGRTMVASSSFSEAGALWSRLALTSRPITASDTSPISVIAQKVERQPRCRPSQAPAGMPSSVASVRPENITEIAEARRSSGTRPVATTAPTPKKVPCVSDVITRAIISVV